MPDSFGIVLANHRKHVKSKVSSGLCLVMPGTAEKKKVRIIDAEMCTNKARCQNYVDWLDSKRGRSLLNRLHGSTNFNFIRARRPQTQPSTLIRSSRFTNFAFRNPSKHLHARQPHCSIKFFQCHCVKLKQHDAQSSVFGRAIKTSLQKHFMTGANVSRLICFR